MLVAVSAAPFIVFGVAIVVAFVALGVRSYLGEKHPVELPESMRDASGRPPDSDQESDGP